MDEGKDASILSSFLVLTTLLLVISSENSILYFSALAIMAIIGSCGHVVFRCFACDRPDIEKTIVCRILVMFSYGIQLSVLCTIVTESFNILAPTWTVKKIEAHPDLTCGLFSLPIFGRNSLTFVGLLIFSVKILQHQFSGEYLEGNDSKLSKLIYFTFSIIIVIPYMVQLLVCQSFCHGEGFKKDMKNTFENHEDIPLKDCWIPFMEFIAGTCLLIVGVLGVVVAFKTEERRSYFCKRNRIRPPKEQEQAQDMEMSNHEEITIRKALEKQQSREIDAEAGYSKFNTISLYTQASNILSAREDAKWRLLSKANCFILALIVFSLVQLTMLFSYFYEDNLLFSTIVFKGSYIIFCYGPFCIILKKVTVIPWFKRKLAERFSSVVERLGCDW